MQLIRNEGGQFDFEEFLSRPLMAHLSTASISGARDSPLWYLWEAGSLWLIAEVGYNTFQSRIKEKPRVAVGIVDFDPVAGRLEHVGIRGNAQVVPWDDARGARLLNRYYRHLRGYRMTPPRAGAKGQVRGRYPMQFVRVDPESVVVRGWEYRDLLVRRAGARRAEVRPARRPTARDPRRVRPEPR